MDTLSTIFSLLKYLEFTFERNHTLNNTGINVPPPPPPIECALCPRLSGIKQVGLLVGRQSSAPYLKMSFALKITTIAVC